MALSWCVWSFQCWAWQSWSETVMWRFFRSYFCVLFSCYVQALTVCSGSGSTLFPVCFLSALRPVWRLCSPSLPRLLRGREAWRPRRKLLSAVLPAWRHSFPADQWTQRRLALRPEPADGTVSDHQPFSQGQLNTSYASELNNHVSNMSLFWEQGLYGLK